VDAGAVAGVAASAHEAPRTGVSATSEADTAWAWLAARRRSGRTRDPNVARALLDRLGLADPPAVVHVVGTNGKGSVATALAAMATAAGRRSGCFVSPHVEHYRERISVDGAHVADDEVVAFTARARALVEDGAPEAIAAGFFEWTLALALDVYAARGVDVAIVEAGVGARRDATLALRNVRASVVTNVDLDHLETLGPDIASIASDKAAALRPGVPTVTCAVGEGLAILRAEAARVGATLVRCEADEPLAALPPDVAAFGRSARWPSTRFDNVRMACAVARLLGWPEAAIEAGARAAPPPARFERFVVDGVSVVLDGAHDPAAARRLAVDLPPDTVLLFGALTRKQGAATLAALAPHVSRVIVTSADADDAPGAWNADAHLADPELALRTALAWAGPGGTVAIAGSLYLAGRVRSVLRTSTPALGAV
jgi:dihydrofolate synthase / folylpolyglutamate synthase